MTRRRASSSPRDTSLRSARATRRSKSSDIRGLLQQGTQPSECPLHAHLERGFARAGDARHLLVGQVVSVLQHDRLSLVGRQALEHAIELGPWASPFAVLRIDGEIQLPNIQVEKDGITPL